MSMKTEDEIIEATEYFTTSLQAASWISTPKTKKFSKLSVEYSQKIKELIHEKRKARKKWQRSRFPPDKTTLNQISKQLDILLQKDKSKKLASTIKNLDITPATNYSLWKVTKSLDKTVHQAPLHKPDGT